MSQDEQHAHMPSSPLPTLTIPQRRVFLSSSSVDQHTWRSRIDQLLSHLGQFSVVSAFTARENPNRLDDAFTGFSFVWYAGGGHLLV
jgi:hypothetical protein